MGKKYKLGKLWTWKYIKQIYCPSKNIFKPDYQIETDAIEATIDIDSMPVYSISTLLISVFEVLTESWTKPFGQMESFDPLR